MNVQLDKIFVALSGKTVLSGLDLSVKSDEYVVILGPSGCGKTTTLRVIAGLQRPDRGNVLFDQNSVTTTLPRHRGVSMVFQQDGLYPHLTVEKSILFGLSGNRTGSSKLAAGEIRRRLDQATELTQIRELLGRYPDQLSGGELRRAAVAKAIAAEDPIRLLDEPLSALDVSARHSLQDDLLRWHELVPGTTIHVTHDGYEAMRMADRIAVMHGGQVAQFDEPSTIYHQPNCVAVALAIGSPSINLIAGRISAGALQSRQGEVQLRLEDSFAGPDRDVVIAVRPESLRLMGCDQDRGCLRISARLVELRPGIRDHSVRADLEGTTLHGVAEQSSEGLGVQSGDVVCLDADRSSLHFFEVESGERIEATIGS